MDHGIFDSKHLRGQDREDAVRACRRDNPGWGYKRIARETGIPPSSVQRIMRRLDLPNGQQHSKQTGLDGRIEEMARTIEELDARLDKAADVIKRMDARIKELETKLADRAWDNAANKPAPVDPAERVKACTTEPELKDLADELTLSGQWGRVRELGIQRMKEIRGQVMPG